MRITKTHITFLLHILTLCFICPLHANDYQQVIEQVKTIYSNIEACDTHLKLGETKAAQKTLEDAERLYNLIKQPDDLLSFRLLAQKGRYFSFTGNHSRALSCMHQALVHKPRLVARYPSEIARLFYDLGTLYDDLENYPYAIRHYQLALSVNGERTESNDPDNQLYHARLAISLYRNCQAAEAKRIIQTCTEFVNQCSDPLAPALLDIYIYLIRYNLIYNQNRAQTEKYLQLATSIMQHSYHSNHYNFSILYYLKGAYHYNFFDPTNALFYCNLSLEILKDYPSLSGYVFDNWVIIAGIYYFYQTDYNKTISYCNQSIQLLEKSHRSPAYFYHLIGLANCILRFHPKEAEYYLGKAIHMTSSKNTSFDISICSKSYFHIAQMYSKKKQSIQVRDNLQKALHVYHKISGMGQWISTINYHLGLSYYRTKDYSMTLRYMQQAIIASCQSFSDTMVSKNPKLQDIIPSSSIIEALTLKANAFYWLNPTDLYNLKFALNCQEMAVKLSQEMIINTNEENAGVVVADPKMRMMNNAVSYAAYLFRETGNRQYADKAFAYAEKSKMQILLISTSKKNKLIAAGVPDTIITRENELNNRILDLENHFALEEKNGNIIKQKNPLMQLILLYEQRDALRSWLMDNYPAYKQTRYDLDVAGIDEIQQMLDDDQVLIEYQLLENEIITFVITQDNVYIHTELIDGIVKENIENLRMAVANRPDPFKYDSTYRSFIRSSSFLYARFIEPIYEKIRGKRLIIVPHKSLTMIPFEVLISDSMQAQKPPDYKSLPYLFKEFPIVYALSANFLLDQDPDKEYGRRTAIFIPDYATGQEPDEEHFPELPGARSEAMYIKKITGGKLFSHMESDEYSFISKAPKYRIIHIASHALSDRINPALSCLVMTEPGDSTYDRFLYAYELRQLDLKAQLVVLSGCNTGYGKLSFSEGLVSLARSFFYTGVRTVAFTLWPVADHAGSSLIVGFYKRLKRHQTLDVALRDSKLDFLENCDPVQSHPYYWAGYVIVGKTHPVPVSRYPWWLKAGLILLIIGGLAMYLKQKIRL